MIRRWSCRQLVLYFRMSQFLCIYKYKHIVVIVVESEDNSFTKNIFSQSTVKKLSYCEIRI